MDRIFAPHPRLYCKQRQNRQRRNSDSRIAQRRQRQHCQGCIRDQRYYESLHRKPDLSGPLQFWCTGKDSNLRTSLGGTDLQSVGFNHSPTCAISAVSVEQRVLSNPYLLAHGSLLTALELFSDTPQPSLIAICATGDQKKRVRTDPRYQLIWEFPYGVPMEKAACPAKCNSYRNRDRSSSAQDSGCGLWHSLTPANRLKLELAEGFEPPTL